MSVFFDLCLNHFNAVYMSVLNKVIRISRLAIDHFFLAVFYFFTFSSVQSLSPVWLFVIPWTEAHQASLSITNSCSWLKLMSIKSVMPYNHLMLCRPLQSFPASESFPKSQFFTSGGQIIGVSASASVLPMNVPGLISFRMDWLDLLAVQGLSRVFSNTTVQKHQFFGTHLSL